MGDEESQVLIGYNDLFDAEIPKSVAVTGVYGLSGRCTYLKTRNKTSVKEMPPMLNTQPIDCTTMEEIRSAWFIG